MERGFWDFHCGVSERIFMILPEALHELKIYLVFSGMLIDNHFARGMSLIRLARVDQFAATRLLFVRVRFEGFLPPIFFHNFLKSF